MPTATLRIRIGASVDRSVETVFGSIEQRAKRAGRVVERQLSGSTRHAGGGRGGPYRTPAREAERSYDRISRAARKSNRHQRQEADRTVKEMERGFRQLARVAAQQTRQQYQEQRRTAEAFRRRTGYYAVRNTGQIARHGARLMNNLARGYGVDFSLQGGMQRGVALNTGAVGIANQERIATGQTAGAAYYEQSARGIAGNLSIDPGKVMAAMRSFTGMTGAFKESNSLISEMSRISVASGANLEEMGTAAGAVYNQMKKLGKDAGPATLAVMRAIAVQAASGSVEVKDYAKLIGRVVAGAGNFKGSISENAIKLSALTQYAAGHGAGNPSRAATAVTAFVNTFSKGRSLKAFQKAGIDVFTDKSKTQIKGPIDIIKEALTKTHGSIPELAKLFPNARAMIAVRGLAQNYVKAGGGKAGLAAVDKALAPFMKKGLSKETERKNIEAYQKSEAAKAQKFQNELDKVVSTMAKDLVPAMEDLAPKAIKVADAMAGIIDWASKNPGEAIVAAIVGGIAKAGLESAGRAALEKAIKGMFSGGKLSTPGGGGTSVGGGSAVAPAAVAAVAGAALAGDQATKLAKEVGLKNWSAWGLLPGFNKKGNFSTDQFLSDMNPFGGVNKRRGKMTWELIHAVMHPDELANKNAKERAAKHPFRQLAPQSQSLDAAKYIGRGVASVASAPSVNPHEIGRSVADGLTGRTINVHVTNMPTTGPVADRGNHKPETP